MSKIKDNIIQPSWDIVSEDLSLKKFYLLPGAISLAFFTALLVYQFVYTYVVIFGQEEKILKIILNYFHSEYLIPTLIIGGICLLFYVVINPLFEIAVIHKINCKNCDNDVTIGEAFGKGLYSFLPIFEYSNTFNSLKILSVFNMYLFSIRFIGVDRIEIISYFFAFLFIIASTINVLSSFTKYIIIVEGLGIFEAFGKSSKMVFLNIGLALRLYFFMFILNIRVVLNFLIFLGIPVGIIAALSFIASKFLAMLAIITISIVGFGMFIVLAYMSTTLDIFKLSVWYFAYKESENSVKRIEGSI